MSILKNMTKLMPMNEVPISEQTGVEKTRSIIVVGVLTLFSITAAALLHVNQPEFILNRFADITEFEYSLFDGVLYLSYLLVGLMVGAFSDKLGVRRSFVYTGSFGSVIFYWLMTTAQSYPLLLAFRFIQGAFTVMVWQTLMTLAIDYSGSHNRGRNMGIFGAFLALAMGLGPAFGGVISSYGVFMPYYYAAALNVVVFLTAIAWLKEPSLKKARPTLRQSLTIAKRHPKLFVPGLFNFIDRLHIGFILVALPLFLSTVLGLSESLRGMALGLFAMPFIILQYPMGKLSDKYGRYRPLVIGSLGYGIILLLLGYFGSFGFPIFLSMLILLGVFSGVTAPPSIALVGDTVGREESAMGMSFFNFMGNLGIVIGPIVFGILMTFADFVTAFLVAGFLELITLAINVIIIKSIFKESLSSGVIDQHISLASTTQ